MKVEEACLWSRRFAQSEHFLTRTFPTLSCLPELSPLSSDSDVLSGSSVVACISTFVHFVILVGAICPGSTLSGVYLQ